MNRFFTASLKPLFFLTLVFAFQTVMAQTTIYTVNSAAATGGNNFQNFTAMTNHFNTNGITGPVVVNVVPGSGPYTDTIHFREINGTSPTNTIRVNGHGETVQFTFNDSFAYYYYPSFILRFDSTDYVTVDSLNFKVKDTGSYYYYNDGGGGAYISGGATYDSITHCVFNLISDSTNNYYNYGSSNGIIIGGQNYYWYYNIDGGGSDCYIGYNHIVDSSNYGNWNYGGYGSFGIAVFDSSKNNIIAHNNIANHPLYGIYLYGCKNTQVLYNDIHGSKDSLTYNGYYYGYYFYGIYTYDTISGTQIIGNRIHDLRADSNYYNYYYSNFYGLYLAGIGTDSSPVLVANNAIYNIKRSGSLYGIWASGYHNLIYQNTVNFDKIINSPQPDYGIYVSQEENYLINNNISITGGGTGMKFGFYYDDIIGDAQKNNFYINSANTGPQYYGYYFSNYFSNITSFQLANSTLELGSPSADPQFIDPVSGNLNVQNFALKGQGVPITAIVPLDILEYTRPALPTLGAFEAVLAMNDAAAFEFVTPKDSFCSSSQPVSISIYNNGVNPINSLQIHWTINGTAQPVVNYSTTLNSVASTTGHYADTITLGNAFFSANASTIIKAWTAMPNGVTDTVNDNDTIVKSFYAISSDYTVTAAVSVICPAMYANLTLVPDTGIVAGLTWQYSTNGANWTDIPNTDTTKYTDTYMNTSKSYRVKIELDQACYSDSVHVSVISPHVLTTNPNGGCDSSQVSLSATSNNGTQLYWYDAPTATNPLDSGATFITPPLMTSTNYYVAASISGLPVCETSRQAVLATIQHPLPNIPLHATTVCTGTPIILVAGDTGTTYQWNTGETSSSINATDSGIYTVLISSFYHCVSSDSFEVNWFPLARVNGFNFIPNYNPLGTVQFSALNPVSVDRYLWDFGDGIQDSTATPVHSYAQTGDYIVSLTVTNHCGSYTVTQMIHVDLTTGIVTVKSDQLANIILYPNPSREYITLKSDNPDLKMEDIAIYDMFGRKVYEAKANGSRQKQITVSQFAAGIYSIKIMTNKDAVIVRKFEIVH